jgi:hypothetical protein
MSNAVLCRHCGEPVRSRGELLVVGRVLAPIHERCRASYEDGQPWHQRARPWNRWSSLVAFNAFMVVGIAVLGALRPDVPMGSAFVILGVANAWLLVGRVVSYVSIERHVPGR